jgi:ATP-dependent RNA helicase RhlE
MDFSTLGLSSTIQQSVKLAGYTVPTPIQVQAIPHILTGRDVLGAAQTGTGKTAAFALPILHRFAQSPSPARNNSRPIRALVLSPTRELAAQIGVCFNTYGRGLNIGSVVIFGGVGQYPQEQALRRGPGIVIATPGRLLDLMGQGLVRLADLEVLVLDEADRMLDMGFINDIRRILREVPAKRQTLFFSATMPNEIRQLSSQILTNPVTVEVAPESTAAETVQQSVYLVAKMDKPALLKHLLTSPDAKRVLVFTRTKHGADKVAKVLSLSGITADAIHGNKSQNARQRALAGFKSGQVRVLVASDIAARGLDVDGISHVVNFDVPNEPETYVHRIGRTGRAGATGIAFSLCDPEEMPYLRSIERIMRRAVAVTADHPYPMRSNRMSSSAPVGGDRSSGKRFEGRSQFPKRTNNNFSRRFRN